MGGARSLPRPCCICELRLRGLLEAAGGGCGRKCAVRFLFPPAERSCGRRRCFWPQLAALRASWGAREAAGWTSLAPDRSDVKILFELQGPRGLDERARVLIRGGREWLGAQ